MAVFISYSRIDQATVNVLARDVEELKGKVWIDRELEGGQAWWDTILGQIRECSLFVFALSPDSLKSRFCQTELRYAVALGRPLLPVMVRDTSVETAPQELRAAQIVDYRNYTAEAMKALVKGLGAVPPAPPLPSTLPLPPPIPGLYGSDLPERVRAAHLDQREQGAIVFELRSYLRDDDQRGPATDLLRELRQRYDISYAAVEEIDSLIGKPTGTVDSGSTKQALDEALETPSTTLGPAAGWYADPTKRFDQRYWDGARWTDHVSRQGRQLTDPMGGASSATSGTSSSASNTATPSTAAAATSADSVTRWDTGTFVVLLIASFFCIGVIGIIVGALNLKPPARHSQARTLIITGVIFAVVLLIFGIVGALSDSSSTAAPI